MTVTSILGLRILVEPIADKEEKTEGGIIAPLTSFISKPKQGIIYLLGGEVNFALKSKGENDLAVGDTILYDRNEYPTINSDGKEYEMITLTPVICTI